MGFSRALAGVLLASLCGPAGSCGPTAGPPSLPRAIGERSLPEVDAVSGASSRSGWAGPGQRGAGPDAAVGTPGKGPRERLLGSDGGERGPTPFDHWGHQRVGADCGSCHHPGSGGRSCTGGGACHAESGAAALPAMEAFHGACRPCHREVGVEGGCRTCHRAPAAATSGARERRERKG